MEYNRRRVRRIINAQHKNTGYITMPDTGVVMENHVKTTQSLPYRRYYDGVHCLDIEWKSFADYIFIIRSENDNPESDDKIERYGLPSDIVSIVGINYCALFKEDTDPLGSAIVYCAKEASVKRYERIIILTDDFYFTEDNNVSKALSESMSFDMFVLNPFDITSDCLSMSLKSSDFIAKNIPDTSKKGWFGRLMSHTTSESSISKGVSTVPAIIHAIDYVFPYVDSSDPEWIALYEKSTRNTKDKKANRFRSYGTLKYHLRGIERFMPFVRKVHLILQSESQIPEWLDTENVNIVFHRDFIPEKHLPTFNSCTIESFLYNIKGVSEHLIYANDDFFPVNPMTPGDFFKGGVPQFITKSAYGSSIYRKQCRNSYRMALREFGFVCTDEFRKPSHISTPMLKRCVFHIGAVYGNEIDNSITMMRSEKNINQYVYSMYQKELTGGGDHNVEYLYMDFSDGAFNICKAISGNKSKMICINDAKSGDSFDKIIKKITEAFEGKLNGKSRFEKQTEPHIQEGCGRKEAVKVGEKQCNRG